MQQQPNGQHTNTIKLPCDDYLIKVIGEAEPTFKEQVLACLDALQVRWQPDSIQLTDSRNGRFVSLSVRIRAESEAQLSRLNVELRQLDCVRMVL